MYLDLQPVFSGGFGIFHQWFEIIFILIKSAIISTRKAVTFTVDIYLL
jgi:hypothetical protein